MPTLAPKLPYTHPFAGGYPRLGGQLLPTDPDAIDYLARVAAADGAAVEVGVAMAVDAFIKGCKADSAGYAGDPARTVWDAIQASCIMCGARTISGALVPLVGPAPTGYGGWASGDYNRSSGLKGNGSTNYLDSNRAQDDDLRNDNHLAVYVASATGSNEAWIGNSNRTGVDFRSRMIYWRLTPQEIFGNANSSTNTTGAVYAGAASFFGVSRDSSSEQTLRSQGVDLVDSQSSVDPSSDNLFVFARNDTDGTPDYSDARLAFYSIGSAIPDLAALDNRVTQLVNGIKFHSLTGLVATDYDPDTVAYIVAAYEAGGLL